MSPFSPLASRSLRWRVIAFSLACLALASSACKSKGHREKGPPAKRKIPTKEKAKTPEHGQALSSSFHTKEGWLQKSRLLSKALGSRLQSELRSALATGDPDIAIQTCATVAPKIAAELSQAGRVQIQRISLKARNSENQADAEDKVVLEKLQKMNEEDPSANLENLEQTGTGKVRYLGGIRIKPMCLGCHGTTIAPPVLRAIRKHYPQDRATGYRLGELRGAFRVDWTLPVPKGLEAPHLRAPKPGLLTGGPPTNRDISTLKELGYSWIIDLRSKGESDGKEGELARSSGMHYVQLPIQGSQGVTFSAAQALRRTLKQAASAGVYLHCASGNRVGALIALLAHQEGRSLNEALNQGRAAGLTSLETRVKALLHSENSEHSKQPIKVD